MVSEHASPLAMLKGVDAGGQNVHVAALSEFIARHGHEVEVFTRRDAADLPRVETMAGGVNVHHVPAGPARMISKDDLLPYMDDFSEYLHRCWSDNPPDVVHSHFWMSGYASVRAAARLGIPVVHTYHALGTVKRRYQGEKDTSHPDRIEIECDIGNRADRIIATCSDEVAELEAMEIDARKTWIIPCGVDLEHFTPDGPTWPNDDGCARLLLAGRLVERKGFGDAVEAMAEIPDAELMIVGGPAEGTPASDPEAIRLRELARACGVNDRLRMVGSVGRDEMPAVIRSADLVLCVPWYEPFGIVPLEAMACGVPVVASATGGMLDSVAEMETGAHVTPRVPHEIAAMVIRLLADRPLIEAMSKQAVRRAHELFDWDLIALKSLHVYDELSSPSRRAPATKAASSRANGES